MYLSFSLLLLPFAFFNIVVFLLNNMPFTETVFTIPLASEPPFRRCSIAACRSRWATSSSRSAMLLLYVEVVKAARPGGKGIIDHLLSFIVFLAMAAELLLVPRAAAGRGTSTLLLLTVLGFVDVIAGLSIRPVHQQIVLERSERATS